MSEESFVFTKDELETEFAKYLNENSMHIESSQVMSDAPSDVRLRSMIVSGPVDEEMSSAITRNLLTFNTEDQDTPVAMYINTYGGSVHDMLAIYDVMQFVKCPIYTVGFGKVMSAGVLLLAAGEPGHRYALPHTSIMVHRVRGGALGTVDDIDASNDHMKSLQTASEALLAKHTKITKKQMKDFMVGADSYVVPKDARTLGIIDHVSAVTPRILL